MRCSTWRRACRQWKRGWSRGRGSLGETRPGGSTCRRLIGGVAPMPTLSGPGSVTGLLERLKSGDHEAARLLWQRYFPRLVALARKKLQAAPRRVADEEDVALSAFDSFCRRAEQGHFPDLKDRDGLWALLVVLTARKAADQLRHQQRDKRGGG